MESVELLKAKKKLTRNDIAELLKSLGEPGENREIKLEAVKQLTVSNFQGVRLESIVEDYQEY